MTTDALPFVFTPDQAYAAGWTPDRLRRAVRRGDLVRLGHRAYAAAETATACRSTPEGRLRLRTAAVTRSTKRPSWASHESALVLHGIPPGRSVPSRAVLTVDDKRGVVHRRTTYDLWPAQLPKWHRTEVAGIPTVSAARAVVERCRHVEFQDRLIVGDAVLHLGRSTPAEIDEVIDFCTGWAGIRGARAAAAAGYFDGKRESPLESLSYAAFIQHGLPLPACQVPIVDVWGELLGIVDFYWRELGVIGEADGRLKYRRSRDGRQPRPTTLLEEKYRQELLEDHAVVVRWGWSDVAVADGAPLVRRVEKAFRPAARRA